MRLQNDIFMDKMKEISFKLKSGPRKTKIDRKFKKITYPSGLPTRWSRNAKRDHQMQATFLKRNDCYTPCARWYIFLFSINVKIPTISVSLSWAPPFCPRKPTLYLTASLRWHRQADVNIGQCDIYHVKSMLHNSNCSTVLLLTTAAPKFSIPYHYKWESSYAKVQVSISSWMHCTLLSFAPTDSNYAYKMTQGI